MNIRLRFHRLGPGVDHKSFRPSYELRVIRLADGREIIS